MFFHLLNYDQKSFGGRGGNLEDKLFLLKEKTGINFYVVFQPVSRKMTHDARDQFANQVLEGSKLPKNEKNVVITIPYISFYNGVISMLNCVQPGFAQNSANLISPEHLGFKEKTDLFEYILGAFTGLEKPMFLRRYFLKANGSLVSFESHTLDNKDIRGHAFINGIQFFESPFLEKIRYTQNVLKSTHPSLDADFNIMKEQREKWFKELNTLFAKAKTDEQNAFNNNNLEFWGDSKEIKELGSLREFYIKDIAISNAFVSSNINSPYIEGWNIFFDDSVLKEYHLNNYETWSVVDNTMYNTLDGISLIPGVDTFSDIVGFVYAGLRGDVLNTTIYGTSAMVPLFGAAYIKGIKKGVQYSDEGFAVVARKTDGKVTLNVEDLSSLKEDGLQVSPVFTNDKALADKITQKEIKDSSVDLETITKILDGNVDDILKRINESKTALTKLIDGKTTKLQAFLDNVDNLSITNGERLALLEKAKTLDDDAVKFINDFATNEDAIVAFANSPNLANSWQLLKTAKSKFVKTDIPRLKIFHKLTPENQAKIAKFTDDKAGATLSKFLDDCDDEFITFVNNVENENIVKGFVSHKKGVDLSGITDEIAELTTEQVDNLAHNSTTTKWYNRSTRITTNNTKFALARKFEGTNSNLIRLNQNPPCGSWDGNAGKDVYKHLQIVSKHSSSSSKRVILDDAIVSRTPEFDKKGNPYYRAIYHDSKLSDGAPWTPNQKSEIIDVFSGNNPPDYIEFEIRNGTDFFELNKNKVLKSNTKIRIYKEDVYKSISNGDGVTIINTIKIFE